MIHQLVKQLELDKALNKWLNFFKIYLPHNGSDHVLNIAYNLLAGGNCLDRLELRRNDVVYLDLLGARRIPESDRAITPQSLAGQSTLRVQ